MSMMEVCMECKNFFLKNKENSIHSGEYTIQNGIIGNVDFLKSGQYFAIKGSDLNDGVYQYSTEPIESLKDEVFSGSVWAMSVPPDFVSLCKEIDEWRNKNESADSPNMSPFSSESVTGVYSYTKSNTETSDGSSVINWQSVFKPRINKWRKLSIL